MQFCPHWIWLSVLVALVAPMVGLAQTPGEREVQLESTKTAGGTLFDALGCPDLSLVGYGYRPLLLVRLVTIHVCKSSPSSPGVRQRSPIRGPQTSVLTSLACGSRKRLRRGFRPVPRLRSRTIATGTAMASILTLAALALACVSNGSVRRKLKPKPISTCSR